MGKRGKSRSKRRRKLRAQRLVDAGQWLETYTGNHPVKDLAVHLGVDNICALNVLKKKGFPITEELENSIRQEQAANMEARIAEKYQEKIDSGEIRLNFPKYALIGENNPSGFRRGLTPEEQKEAEEEQKNLRTFYRIKDQHVFIMVDEKASYNQHVKEKKANDPRKKTNQKKKKKNLKHKRLNRKKRLVAAKTWLEDYPEKPTVKAFAEHFGTDNICAAIELKMLGVEISQKYEERLIKRSLQAKKTKSKKKRSRKKNSQNSFDWEAKAYPGFAFIAGYTSNGVPFGLTHEEMKDIDEEQKRLREIYNEPDHVFIIVDEDNEQQMHDEYLECIEEEIKHTTDITHERLDGYDSDELPF